MMVLKVTVGDLPTQEVNPGSRVTINGTVPRIAAFLTEDGAAGEARPVGTKESLVNVDVRTPWASGTFSGYYMDEANRRRGIRAARRGIQVALKLVEKN